MSLKPTPGPWGGEKAPLRCCVHVRMVNLFLYVTLSPAQRREDEEAKTLPNTCHERRFSPRRYMFGEFLISLIIRRCERWAVVEAKNDSKETAQGEKCLLSYLVTVMRTRTNYYNFAVLIFSTYIAIHFSSLAIYLCVHPRSTRALLQIEELS